MSQLTSLQLVNKVLVNMRENTVSDLSASNSMLILEFLNQAKEKVEEVHNWKILNTSLSFVTVLSQTRYPLNAAAVSPVVTSSTGMYPNEHAEVLRDPEGNWSVYDTTTASSGGLIRLRRTVGEEAVALNLYLANQAPVQPNAFSYTWGQTSGVGTALFFLVGAPTAGRTMTVRMKCPQEPFSLVAGTEALLVPWRPVVDYATFIALEERGEELSERSSLYLDRHNASLQRAIEKDESGEEAYEQLKNIEGHGVGALTAGYY